MSQVIPMSPTRSIPDHIPPELVWDQSISEFASELSDPFQAIARLHEGPDIFWSNHGYWGVPAWFLTRFSHIKEVFLDHKRFPSGRHSNNSEAIGVEWRMIPVETDPPLHQSYRKILMPWFTPQAITNLEEQIRRECRELIAGFQGRASCEFISEFACLFPARIFLAMMGIPGECAKEFLPLANAWLRGENTERLEAAKGIIRTLQRYIAERQSSPGEDLISIIATANIDGRPITSDETLATCFTLFIGGLDTVANSLGWQFRHLASDQALQQRLRNNPTEIPRAVDEMLRAFSITFIQRTVAHDLDFHGIRFRAGDNVILIGPLEGRDPLQFHNPHMIDVDRKSNHLTFGNGIHSCLGVLLARREIKIAMEEMLRHFENIRIPIEEKVVVHTTGVWGVDKLPLTWG